MSSITFILSIFEWSAFLILKKEKQSQELEKNIFKTFFN